MPAPTAQAPKTTRSPRKAGRLWVRATAAEKRAAAWVIKQEGLARGEVLRRYSLNTIVAMYEARPGVDVVR